MPYTLGSDNPSCQGCGMKKNPYKHNLFRINKKGRITYQGSGEDYESGNTSYVLTVTATDNAGQSADMPVTINITDVSEGSGNQPPQFRKSTYTFKLRENRGKGWQTKRISAHDPDGDNSAVTYFLGADNPACESCGPAVFANTKERNKYGNAINTRTSSSALAARDGLPTRATAKTTSRARSAIR